MRVLSEGRRGAFLQASAEQPLPAPYSSGSGGIGGIFAQMLEEFGVVLQGSQKFGVTGVADHEALAAAQTKRISAAKEGRGEMEAMPRRTSLSHATSVCRVVFFGVRRHRWGPRPDLGGA